MKRVIITTAFAAITLASCQKDCNFGYGPNGDDCEVTWASQYDKTWSGTADCGQGSTLVLGNIEEETATRFRIDDAIYAELTSANVFEIPEQVYVFDGQNFTVRGQGSLNNGELRMTHYTSEGNTQWTCYFEMN